MSGNVNTYLVVRQKLELPFVATKIRFIPFSEHPRTVCMRVELFGCLWNRKYRFFILFFLDLEQRLLKNIFFVSTMFSLLVHKKYIGGNLFFSFE